ncbi:MAG: ferredoxin family protein [Burkholderiales bacterium]|nr:ferredoxin family protein [Burkholderiales bacterium]MDE1926559.1 ferredoxin family protein [Burkholderiales bacterium]MDE2501995.1 ferredoxin family protein [Burkholderiales bacterium]
MAPPAIDPNACKAEPGALRPVIDRNRCEGKAGCVAVCPYGIFAIGTLPADQRAGLNWKGRLKGFAHGWQQALLLDVDACRACALCVAACPEHAIRLERRRPGPQDQ